MKKECFRNKNPIINKIKKQQYYKSCILTGYFVSRMACLLGLGGGVKG